jgi:hypothetical protein
MIPLATPARVAIQREWNDRLWMGLHALKRWKQERKREAEQSEEPHVNESADAPADTETPA